MLAASRRGRLGLYSARNAATAAGGAECITWAASADDTRGYVPMIDLTEVGAHIDSGANVRFGLYLPEITAAKGYAVVVRVIHELDQFAPEIPPRDFALQFDPAHP